MPDRSLWNWTIILGAALAVVGVIVAWLLQTTLPSSLHSTVAVVFFILCLLAIGGLFAFFTLRRR